MRALGHGAVALVVAAALALVVPAGATASPARSGRRTADAAPSIRLTSQSVSVGSEDAFTVFLQVDGAPSGADVLVDIYDRVEDPTKVGEDPSSSQGTFDPIPLGDAQPGPRTTGFAIELYSKGQPRPENRPWAWRIDQAGVYPVRVELRAADDSVLATLVTQLVRRPSATEEVHTAHVAVVARVHRDPGAEADSPLPTSFRRHLDRFLAALRSHPTLAATFSVTPETAERMAADRSSVRTLTRLRTEVRRRGRELLDAPYVDIDPPSLVAAGLADELGRQRDLGRNTLSDLLDSPTTGSWRMERPLDGASLAALRARGIFRLLIPGATLRGSAPAAPMRLDAGDGQVRAIAVDRRFALDPKTSGTDPVLAAHRLLARLAATADDAPDTQTIVVSIDTATVDALALPTLFDGLVFGGPFFTAETVDGLFDGTEAAQAPTLAPMTPRRLGSTGQLAADVQALLGSYQSMAPTRPDLVSRYRRPLAVAASVDLPLAERRRRLGAIDQALERRVGLLSTPAKDKVTVGARDARFPLTITSALRYPIQVVIHLEANDRLDFPRNDIEQTVQPGRTVVPIRVHTNAAGDTPVRITVRTPDGRVVLAQSQYTIRSTVVSGIGLILTIGAALFLALWWGRHILRSRRTPKHARTRHPAGGEPVASGAVGDPM